MLNKIILEGRLVKQPQLSQGKNGKEYSLNTLAVQVNKEKAYFIPFTAFGNAATLMGQYCNKGDLVSLEGEVATMKRKDAQFEELCVNVFSVHFLGKSNKSTNNGGYTHDEHVQRIYK